MIKKLPENFLYTLLLCMRVMWLPSVGVVAVLSAIAWMPLETILRSVVLDDTFYYAKIAWHVVHTGKLSFDGINPTNGFHPAWLVLIVPLAALFSDLETLLRAMLFLQALIGGIGAGALWEFLSRFSRSLIDTVISWAAILFLYYANWILISGMEGGLILLLLIGSLQLYESFVREPTQSKALYLGLAWGALFLTRIDSAFILLGIGLAWLAFLPSKQHLKGLLLAGGVAGSGLSMYLALNWLFFGHILPVSAIIKINNGHYLENVSYFIDIIGNFLRVGRTGAYITLAALGIGLFWTFVKYIFWVRLHSKEKVLPALDVVVLFSAMVHAVLIAFTLGKVYAWHLFLESFAIGWIFLRATQIWTKVKWILRGAFVGVMLWSWYPILYKRWTPADRELNIALYDTALWLKKHLSPNALIGSFDAGIIGYFSERKVVNLDGLVNSPDFIPYVVGDSVYAYLRKQQIGYLAQLFWDDMFRDGRLGGPETAWRALFCDTLYVRPFQFRTAGIFSTKKEAPGYVIVLRLKQRDLCPQETAGEQLNGSKAAGL